MKYYGDYHTHSQHSDGRQSVEDIINAAIEKGLQEIAITDHGPLAAVIGINNAAEYSEIKNEIRELSENKPQLRILLGAEANIRDLNGTLDLDFDTIEEFDILIAGLHPYTLPSTIKDGIDLYLQNSLRHLGKSFQNRAINANTKALVEAIYNNPKLDILAHPGLFFKVDITEVARACMKKGVLFEINCGHKHPDISGIIEANRTGVDFIINSDAHFPDSVGNLGYGTWLIERLGIEEERVANLSEGGYRKWAKKLKDCE